MAKKLGFRPDTLVRARRGPKNKWKLPVNQWVCEPYRNRFGDVLVKMPLPAPVPLEVELDQEAMRQFEEELFWEDYWARNEDESHSTKRRESQAKLARVADSGAAPCQQQGIVDDSIPF
jgi:hypothetical protein